MLREIIISLLNEENYNFTMRPVNMPWVESVFLALIAPDLEDDYLMTVIEFNHVNDSCIMLNVIVTYTDGRPDVTRTHLNFNLADVESYNKLKKYLEKVCKGVKSVVEFEASLGLDFALAGQDISKAKGYKPIVPVCSHCGK